MKCAQIPPIGFMLSSKAFLKAASQRSALSFEKADGNHPIFKRPDFWTSRGKFQFHGGGDAADAHVRALVVVSP